MRVYEGKVMPATGVNLGMGVSLTCGIRDWSEEGDPSKGTEQEGASPVTGRNSACFQNTLDGTGMSKEAQHWWLEQDHRSQEIGG